MIHTLLALQEMWNHLARNGFRFFNLRSVNQDPLEIFFGLIRQNNGNNRNPTVTHFMSAAKTCLVNGMTGPHSRSANCEADSAFLWSDLRDLVFNNSPSQGKHLSNYLSLLVILVVCCRYRYTNTWYVKMTTETTEMQYHQCLGTLPPLFFVL